MIETVARAFDRAVDYDRHAGVQRQVAEALAVRIAEQKLPPRPRVLEIGCGTGFLGAALMPRLPGADWLMTDIAPAMIDRAAQRFAGIPGVRFALMDGEAPGVAGPFDLICSSLAAQWFADLDGALTRLAALLAPGGLLAIATLAEGSFAEWRAAHDAAGVTSGTPDYPALDDPIEPIVVDHADAPAFLRALKAIGAGTPRTGHRPLSPPQLRAVMRHFETGGARVTYRIAYHLRRA
ncbi:MAG: hypothetical protein JWO65_1327 [Sphingomonas bacterium]|nr:hypothetical protein [Sphingomonas bacterium]